MERPIDIAPLSFETNSNLRPLEVPKGKTRFLNLFVEVQNLFNYKTTI